MGWSFQPRCRQRDFRLGLYENADCWRIREGCSAAAESIPGGLERPSAVVIGAFYGRQIIVAEVLTLDESLPFLVVNAEIPANPFQ